MSPSATSPATFTSGLRSAATHTGRSGRSGALWARRERSSCQKSAVEAALGAGPAGDDELDDAGRLGQPGDRRVVVDAVERLVPPADAAAQAQREAALGEVVEVERGEGGLQRRAGEAQRDAGGEAQRAGRHRGRGQRHEGVAGQLDREHALEAQLLRPAGRSGGLGRAAGRCQHDPVAVRPHAPAR